MLVNHLSQKKLSCILPVHAYLSKWSRQIFLMIALEENVISSFLLPRLREYVVGRQLVKKAQRISANTRKPEIHYSEIPKHIF